MDLFKFTKDAMKNTHTATLTTSYSEAIDAVGEAMIIRKLVDELVDKWIEQYGQELVDAIDPTIIEKELKQTLAKRILSDN